MTEAQRLERLKQLCDEIGELLPKGPHWQDKAWAAMIMEQWESGAGRHVSSQDAVLSLEFLE